MKYIVITDQPIVLEKIKLQGHNEIRELSYFDHIGESAQFELLGGSFICPKCGQAHPSWLFVRFCVNCGCQNESV